MIRASDKAVNWIAFSPDGRLLASAQDDNTVRLWETHTGAELKSLNDHIAPVLGVEFSSDRRHLATCGRDLRVLVWNLFPGSPPDKKAQPKRRGRTAGR